MKTFVSRMRCKKAKPRLRRKQLVARLLALDRERASLERERADLEKRSEPPLEQRRALAERWVSHIDAFLQFYQDWEDRLPEAVRGPGGDPAGNSLRGEHEKSLSSAYKSPQPERPMDGAKTRQDIEYLHKMRDTFKLFTLQATADSPVAHSAPVGRSGNNS